MAPFSRNEWPEENRQVTTKLIFLALRNITAKWKRPPKEWHAAKGLLAIHLVASRGVVYES